jgi:hypothetical protein
MLLKNRIVGSSLSIKTNERRTKLQPFSALKRSFPARLTSYTTQEMPPKAKGKAAAARPPVPGSWGGRGPAREPDEIIDDVPDLPVVAPAPDPPVRAPAPDLPDNQRSPPGAPPGVALAAPSGAELLEQLQREHAVVQSAFEVEKQAYMDAMPASALTEKTTQGHLEQFAVDNYNRIRDTALAEHEQALLTELNRRAGAAAAATAAARSAGIAAAGSAGTAAAGSAGAAAAAPSVLQPPAPPGPPAAGPAGDAATGTAGAAAGSAGAKAAAARPRLPSLGDTAVRRDPIVELPDSDDDQPALPILRHDTGAQIACHKCKVLLTTANKGVAWPAGAPKYGRCTLCTRFDKFAECVKAPGQQTTAIQRFLTMPRDQQVSWFQQNDRAGLLASHLKTNLEASFSEEYHETHDGVNKTESDWLTEHELVTEKKLPAAQVQAIMRNSRNFFDGDIEATRYEYRSFKSSDVHKEHYEGQWKRKAIQGDDAKGSKKNKGGGKGSNAQIGSAEPKEPKPPKYTAAQVAGLEKWKGKLNASMEENEELMKMLSELPPAVRRGLKDEEAALKQCRKEIQQQQSQCDDLLAKPYPSFIRPFGAYAHAALTAMQATARLLKMKLAKVNQS